MFIANTSSQSFEICALLGYYAPQNGSFLPAFRENLSVPSSGAKQSILDRGESLKLRIKVFHDRIMQDCAQLTWH
jgi:hypothetical protein